MCPSKRPFYSLHKVMLIIAPYLHSPSNTLQFFSRRNFVGLTLPPRARSHAPTVLTVHCWFIDCCTVCIKLILLILVLFFWIWPSQFHKWYLIRTETRTIVGWHAKFTPFFRSHMCAYLVSLVAYTLIWRANRILI